MATMTELPGVLETSHTYHAEADVLSGHLRLPVNQEIPRQAVVTLEDRRGGYLFQRAEKYSLEGLITFKSAYSHVSGNRSLKNHGWITLATSVLEGLNVLDVITADRVVAQVSTEHPIKDGHVPHVTFLGTQFENLRIGGYAVQVELDLGICGEKPEGDIPYTSDSVFLNRVEQQCESIVGTPDFPAKLRVEYDAELKYLADLRAGGNGSGRRSGEAPETPKVKCSLVKRISPVPVAKWFGNVLEIPGFGIVSLAEVEVSDYFELTMLNMSLGCIGDGTIKTGYTKTNGQTIP